VPASPRASRASVPTSKPATPPRLWAYALRREVRFTSTAVGELTRVNMACRAHGTTRAEKRPPQDAPPRGGDQGLRSGESRQHQRPQGAPQAVLPTPPSFAEADLGESRSYQRPATGIRLPPYISWRRTCARSSLHRVHGSETASAGTVLYGLFGETCAAPYSNILATRDFSCAPIDAWRSRKGGGSPGWVGSSGWARGWLLPGKGAGVLGAYRGPILGYPSA